jgi:hypothetical protein
MLKNICAASILRTFILLELCLVFMYWIGFLLGEPNLLLTLFDLDREANIPAWFSSSQLLLICLMTWLACLLHKTCERPSRLFLFITGTVFLLMSLDETSQVHESITAFLGDRYVDWIPPLILKHKEIPVLSLALLIFFIRLIYPDLKGLWLWSRRKSFIAVAGIFTYMLGASVLETIGYEFIERDTFIYRIEVSAEEFLEMLGASLILYTVVSFVQDKCRVSLYQESV